MGESISRKIGIGLYDEPIIVAKKIAKYYGWIMIDHQKDNYMISFTRDGVRLNYWYTRGTVGTALEHPVKGKTQLFRKGMFTMDLIKIFENPRVHTGEGYYTK